MTVTSLFVLFFYFDIFSYPVAIFSPGLQFVFSLIAKLEKSDAVLKETKKSMLVLDILRAFERVTAPTVMELAAAKKICKSSLS